MRSLIAACVLGAAGLAWSGAAAQAPPQASPGTGVVTIAGTVEVANTPSVNAGQLGEWKVAVANTPSVTTPPPDFLRAGGRYDVTWANGDAERVVLEQIGRDGWVRVQAPDGTRWINVAAARSLLAKR